MLLVDMLISLSGAISMKPTSLAIILATAGALVACAAPIPPRFSDPPREESPPPRSVNQPSQVESTAAEYDGQSGSTGSSTR
jgi:hypothetical protein